MNLSSISAMVLAAGRGERMRPLTDSCPKPLLAVNGKPLMQWHMEALAQQGYTQLVINTAWLGDQIENTFGPAFTTSGAAMHIRYSSEGRDFGGALETAGGICRALPQLSEVFWAVAGDVFVPDFQFDPACVERFIASNKLGHLWLIPNPAHNPRGDFGLHNGLAQNLPADSSAPRYTYSTIALYRRALFNTPWCDIAPGNPQGTKAPLAPLLRAAMDQGHISAEIYHGRWTDVGTPERLAQLNASFHAVRATAPTL